MSQACEINNNKELTVLHLQIVSQKECGKIKWGLFLATKLYFQCKENLLGTKVGYFKFKIQLSTRKHQKISHHKHFQPYSTEQEWKCLITCDRKVKMLKQVHLLPKFLKMTSNCTCPWGLWNLASLLQINLCWFIPSFTWNALYL